MTESVVTIHPDPIGWEHLPAVSAGRLSLQLSEISAERISKCRNWLDEKALRHNKPVYGVTTGFGALHNRTINRDQLTSLQRNLVMSHACGTGDEVSAPIVRLMLYLKAQALSYGLSGVQLLTVQRLLDFFNEDVLPVVYEQGSLGASGDLAPLAHLVLPLLGMGEVRYGGKRFPSAEILNKFGWEPVKLQSKEGLALLNGTQFMSAHGVWVLLQAGRLAKIADICGSLSLDAYNGRPEPFLSELHDIRPHAGQKETAANIRKLLKRSQIFQQGKKHVQDPYSFRCIPQVHGASKDAIHYVQGVVETEINSVTDNPTVFPDLDKVISGGNFHGQPLALSFDYLAMGLAELGSISERRVYRLISGQRNLPEFLVANPGLNSGFMIPQYTAASIVSQNKQLCSPCSVDSIPSSNEQEDHVSMGANAATRLVKITDNLETILGIEIFTAAQALEFRRPLRSSDYLENLVADYRKQVPFVEEDRVLYPEIHKSREFLRSLHPKLESVTEG